MKRFPLSVARHSFTNHCELPGIVMLAKYAPFPDDTPDIDDTSTSFLSMSAEEMVPATAPEETQVRISVERACTVRDEMGAGIGVSGTLRERCVG